MDFLYALEVCLVNLEHAVQLLIQCSDILGERLGHFEISKQYSVLLEVDIIYRYQKKAVWSWVPF